MRDPVDQFNARGQTLEDQRDVGFFDLLIDAIRIVCNVPDRCSRPAAVRAVRDADLHRDRSRRDRELLPSICSRIVVAVLHLCNDKVSADICGQGTAALLIKSLRILIPCIIGESRRVQGQVVGHNRRIVHIVAVDPGLRKLDPQRELLIGDRIADRDLSAVHGIVDTNARSRFNISRPLIVIGIYKREDDFIASDIVIR